MGRARCPGAFADRQRPAGERRRERVPASRGSNPEMHGPAPPVVPVGRLLRLRRHADEPIDGRAGAARDAARRSRTLLRGERKPLSPDEINEVLRHRLSYLADDPDRADLERRLRLRHGGARACARDHRVRQLAAAPVPYSTSCWRRSSTNLSGDPAAGARYDADRRPVWAPPPATLGLHRGPTRSRTGPRTREDRRGRVAARLFQLLAVRLGLASWSRLSTTS